MKTNIKTKRTNVEKSYEVQSLDGCKLERLKMTGAYGTASQAQGWAEGIKTQQVNCECAVVRKRKRSVSSHRPRLASGRP